MKMVVLFTDFGSSGPYLGQMEAVLRQSAPQLSVINLVSNAPRSPRISSYLLAALRYSLPEQSVFVAVVDPGVGGPRLPLVLYADGQWFVGPDNDLLNTVAKQSIDIKWWIITWRPESCSTSFHGRDIFAPIAAMIVTDRLTNELSSFTGPDLTDWLTDINEIIYFDDYGNAFTGLRYSETFRGRYVITEAGQRLPPADTFCSVAKGAGFWYRNSNDLVEIAINQGSVVEQFKVKLGDLFTME
ncbi:MAG: SAM-dependent chlorinase/fluorinase [Methylococcaceae bacterium]